jgi:hypothetical protein
MTTNRKTIQVRIRDDGTLFTIALTAGIGCSIAVGLAVYSQMEAMGVSLGVVLVCLAASTGVLTSIIRKGLSTTIEIDPNDLKKLIPQQETVAPTSVVEPEESESEPEAEEPEDDSPAGPQWFETPYPDPDTDTELKAEEAPKA